jgi:hypothetical protein
VNIPIDSAFDPNSQFSGGQLALITRARQELQNKSNVAAIGETLDALHRIALDIESQVQRMAIKTDDDFAKAGVLLKAVKVAISTSEDERKLVKAPIKAVASAVDAAFAQSHTTLLVELKGKVEEAMRAFRKRAAALDLPADNTVESHGVQTQVRKTKSVVIDNLRAALAYISKHATDTELAAVIELKPRALTALLTRLDGGELTVGSSPAGYTVTETEGFANI